jgi:sporulation protein YlmC with PRC-barrel domain
MLKKFLIATAAGGLMMSTALAQQSPAPSPSAPAASPPAASPATPATDDKAPKADSAAPKADSAAMKSDSAMKSDAKFVAKQSADQWSASRFKGTDVVGTDNQKIGDVSDVLFDKDAKVVAYIVGVGGFLGIGAKDVALDPKAFQVVPGDNGMYDAKLKLAMTKDELKNAPAFEKYSPPPRTTGTAPGTSPRPAGTTGSTTR